MVFNPSFNPHGNADKGIIIGTFNAQTKEFKETDEITINFNFVATRQKFTTQPLVVKKTAAEAKESELEEAAITKKYQDNILQATLTRIMKSKIGYFEVSKLVCFSISSLRALQVDPMLIS